MKVIDLLNKIANGEKVPSPIYHNNLYYDFEDGDYFNQKTRNWLFNDSDIESILNDEVLLNDDIIEELDIPGITIPKEKLEPINIEEFLQVRKTKKILFLANKINEIIDYINKE